VTDTGASAADLSIALAVGLWLAALASQWIMLLWGLKNLVALQKAAARRVGWKLLAAGCWTASVLLAFVGTVLQASRLCHQPADPKAGRGDLRLDKGPARTQLAAHLVAPPTTRFGWRD